MLGIEHHKIICEQSMRYAKVQDIIAGVGHGHPLLGAHCFLHKQKGSPTIAHFAPHSRYNELCYGQATLMAEGGEGKWGKERKGNNTSLMKLFPMGEYKGLPGGYNIFQLKGGRRELLGQDS